ncbi:hypothetical protein BT96DRAFT_980462 [Gymnopus androsaceus JB14]|uniref:Sulfate transporter family protein n=1 Tax=Gymnopus androsaceus JB14 TaxID=1447944 RepID=A0A6A4GYI3_9AGAR|nr:hypothetical protein BT96DRAFT_980462 [Gymnopus androsaceus JB14]
MTGSRPVAGIEEPEANFSQDRNHYGLDHNPSIRAEPYPQLPSSDPSSNQKMVQQNSPSPRAVDPEDLSSSPHTTNSSPVFTQKKTRRFSNQHGSPSSPNLHRAGLLQPMAPPFSYNANPNSMPLASVTSFAVTDEERSRSRGSLSSSSSSDSFASIIRSSSPTAQSTPPSLSDGGVGHAHPSGTPARVVPHSQHTIRDITMELSGLMVPSIATPSSFPSMYDSSNVSQARSIGTPSTLIPHSFGAFDTTIRVEPRSFSVTGDNFNSTERNDDGNRGDSGENIKQRTDVEQFSELDSGADDHPSQFKSALSLLLHSSPSSPVDSSPPPTAHVTSPPRPSRASSHSSTRTVIPASSSNLSEQESSPEELSTPIPSRVGSPYPTQPSLLPPHHLPSPRKGPDVHPVLLSRKSTIRWDPALRFETPKRDDRRKLKSITDSTKVQQVLRDTTWASFRAIPAVLLGCLLNVLDAISYGMIIFPTSAPFTDLGPMGVSMFFVSTIVAQLSYTFSSGFAGGNGSMMIEVVPFFHIMAATIAEEVGEDKPAEVIATTIVAYALSSVLTGLSFFLLGALRLGALIGFFPRHILVGCIGGVGAFLIETGLTVSMRIPEDDFVIDLETLKFMFLDPHNLALWTVPLGLAILLRVITSKWSHQLIFPVYFVIIPVLFYIVVAAAQLNLDEVRKAGWLFDPSKGESGEPESWWKFYTYFDWSLIHLGPLWSTLPTQFALLFFNVLHPPLNVPALSVSLNEDVDTNKELVGHGYSNILAGAFGTVPNYLVYVNTLLFYRVGGDTRVAGFLLAVATIVLLLVGTGPIAYIPVSVVGALILVLGIDLVKEALWDTRHRVSRTEYITIVSIIVAMTVWDFVIGVLFGIVVSCFFFVVQNSQRRSIRAFHTGENQMSTVRRPSAQRAYLKEVSKQTTILRLQGFLFFGTITYVEEAIRGALDAPSWQRNPIRFLVVDLTMVAGVDMSSAEAFVRVQRLLAAKLVTLVFCGFEVDSAVGKALESVGVMGSEGVELFATLNNAIEWTENAYLQAYFRSQKFESSIPFALPGRQDVDIINSYQSSQPLGSPRRSMISDAGIRTMAKEIRSPPMPTGAIAEPLPTLIRAFSSFGDIDHHQFSLIVPYFQRMSVPQGFVLWQQGDPPDALFLVESGILRATYQFAEYSQSIEESMVPGTLAGELSALSNLPRNATAVVERPAVLWKLSIEDLSRLEAEEPTVARNFTHMVLKSAKIDYDTLLAALASRQ